MQFGAARGAGFIHEDGCGLRDFIAALQLADYLSERGAAPVDLVQWSLAGHIHMAHDAEEVVPYPFAELCDEVEGLLADAMPAVSFSQAFDESLDGSS